MTRAMKDSGIEWIGQIPENWILTKIKYNNLIYTGNSISDNEKDNYQYQDNSVPYISTKDIDATTNSITYDTGMFISCMDKNFKIAPKNSSLLCIEGGSAGKKIGFTERDVCFVNKLCCFQSLKKCLSKYIYYSLQSSSFLTDFFLSMSGLIGGVSTKQIKNIFLPIPPISEQQKIADYLDKRCEKIDTAIDNQKQIIEKLKEYKQSLITETVTKGLNPNAKMKDSGIEWIGSIPEHWQDIKLKFNSYIRARLGWKGLKAEEYVEQGYPLLSAFNIINNKLVFEDLKFINQMRYDESPEIKLQKDDILLVKDGAGIGKCALVTNLPFPSTVNGSIAVVTTNKNLTSKFLYYYFLSKLFQAYIERLKDGMGVPHLFQSDLKEICIVSPNKLEQKEITEYLDKKCNQIDEAIKQKEETINKLEEYKKSLIFECVTGKKEVA